MTTDNVVGASAPTTKTCSKCGEEKPLAEFHKSKAHRLGVLGKCKTCSAEYRFAYREAKREQLLVSAANYREANREKERERHRRYKADNRDAISIKNKRQWEIRRQDPMVRLENAIYTAISASIANGIRFGRSKEAMLGYTMGELKAHLESRFKPGMSWDNYGKDGWEVDHIIPRSLFNYGRPTDIDFQRCWSLKNLQPMWARDNRSKGARYAGGFQPSLPIG